jgi:death-on-curing protein
VTGKKDRDSRVLAREPRWLTETTLLAIHAQQVERYGGAHGVIDPNVVFSALARPRNRWAYDAGADLADLAAAYLVGFTRTQGFRDGNKRTGLACALVFLDLNGAPLHATPADLYGITMAAALGQADDSKVAALLRERLRPGRS